MQCIYNNSNYMYNFPRMHYLYHSFLGYIADASLRFTLVCPCKVILK